MYKLPFLRSWAKTISPKNSFQVYRKAFLIFVDSSFGKSIV